MGGNFCHCFLIGAENNKIKAAASQPTAKPETLKYKIKMPDAVIAATALINNLTLVTANAGDFESTGVKLLIPELR